MATITVSLDNLFQKCTAILFFIDSFTVSSNDGSNNIGQSYQAIGPKTSGRYTVKLLQFALYISLTLLVLHISAIKFVSNCGPFFAQISPSHPSLWPKKKNRKLNLPVFISKFKTLFSCTAKIYYLQYRRQVFPCSRTTLSLIGTLPWLVIHTIGKANEILHVLLFTFFLIEPLITQNSWKTCCFKKNLRKQQLMIYANYLRMYVVF